MNEKQEGHAVVTCKVLCFDRPKAKKSAILDKKVNKRKKLDCRICSEYFEWSKRQIEQQLRALPYRLGLEYRCGRMSECIKKKLLLRLITELSTLEL